MVMLSIKIIFTGSKPYCFQQEGKLFSEIVLNYSIGSIDILTSPSSTKKRLDQAPKPSEDIPSCDWNPSEGFTRQVCTKDANVGLLSDEGPGHPERIRSGH